MVENIGLDQGLDFVLFQLCAFRRDLGNGFLGIKPAEFTVVLVVYREDPAIGLVNMFFLLDGADDFYRRVKWEKLYRIVIHTYFSITSIACPEEGGLHDELSRRLDNRPGTDAAGAYPYMGGIAAVADRANFLEIGQPAPAVLVVGVAYIIAGGRSFAADIAYFSHG